MNNISKNKIGRICVGAFSLLVCVFMFAPSRSFAYPAFTNVSTGVVGPYDDVSGDTLAGTLSPGGTYRYFFVYSQQYRIRQSGTITSLKLFFPTPTGSALTGFKVQIWRASGSNFNLVGESEDLLSKLTPGQINTVNLASPITGVKEGDYYGFDMVGSAGGGTNELSAKTGVTNANLYYITFNTPGSTNYNWTAQGAIANWVVPIDFYMTAPQVVFIGDSIIAGHTANYSFLENTATTTNLASTIEDQFGTLTGYTFQNMGIGGQTSAQISARFAADAIGLNPKAVVIEGGVNDIIAGNILESTFLANWTSMLNAAQANSNISTVMVLKILPWTNGTTIQMQTRDAWNNDLAALAAGYSKAIVVDASSYVGQFRAGGDAGNFWDIKPAYSADGIHCNQAGYGQVAQAIADNLPSTVATVTSSTYTVSALSGGVGTISNVPYGTAKATFLSAPNLTLARGASWNTASIADPVASGNTLVVTTQDGTATGTYTIAVNAATPPTVLSAATNSTGTIVTVVFSKAMSDPSTHYTEFTVNNGSADAVTAAVLEGDAAKIDLTVATPILHGQTVTVTYSGSDVVATDTGILASFSGQAVTNNGPTTISATAIAGVTPPAAGATPVASVTAGIGYIGTVSWNGNPATFASSTIYTATITLSATTGYTLQGVSVNQFTIAGSTSAANSANLGIITATFPMTASSTKDITAFSFAGLTPAVAASINGAAITATVPYGTPVTALVATFASTGLLVAVGATPQVSGTTPNDFTAPQTYTVTAADSSTQDYTVTVTVKLPAPTPTPTPSSAKAGGGGALLLLNLLNSQTIAAKQNIARPPAVMFVQPLKYGSQGNQTVALQDILKKLGLFPESIASNGNFGPTTQKAVQAFQMNHNIAKPGEAGYGNVGPNTRRELNMLSRQ